MPLTGNLKLLALDGSTPMKYNLLLHRIKSLYNLLLVCSMIQFSYSILSAKEFKIISLDNFGKIEQIKFQDESATQKITIKKYYPNRSFRVPVHNLIHFYGINSETGAYSRKPLLRISFADQEGDSIVFLRSDKDDPENIKYEFLKNDTVSFPILSTMILNLSDKQVIAKIGGEIINLPPNSQKLFPLPKNERGSFSEKVFFAARKKNNSIDYFYGSFWRVPSGHKTLCIIDYNTESDSHKLTEILL